MTFTNLLTQDESRKVFAPLALSFLLHMELTGIHLNNWQEYEWDFRYQYPLYMPSSEAYWRCPLSAPLYDIYTIATGYSSAGSARPVSPVTSSTQNQSARALAKNSFRDSSPSSEKGVGKPVRGKPCLDWNKPVNICSDSPICPLGWGHFCKRCRGDHSLPNCTASSDKRSAPSSGISANKKDRRCEYAQPFIDLPSPRAVCTYDVEALEEASAFMGDSPTRTSVLDGLRHGFCFRFDHSSSLRPCSNPNGRSALDNPSVVDALLEKEISAGATLGPFVRPPVPDMQISRINLKDEGTKFRLLFDLSAPFGHSVNAGISPEDASVTYVKVKEICKKILDIGQGALIGKFDLSRAYRHVPVCPADRRLLGFKWRDQYYLDLVLPFGGRSCCSIFNGVADFFCEIFDFRSAALELFHYLDDFITAGDPMNAAKVRADFEAVLSLCNKLGIVVSQNKTVFPTTRLTFLGFLIDTILMTLSLPEEKIVAYREVIRSSLKRRSLQKKDLLSLLGKLLHAAVVVPIGRAFLRTLINRTYSLPTHHSWCTLSKDDRLNLQWWDTLLSSWNGVSLMRYGPWLPLPDFELASDAALKIGYGIVMGNEWVAGRWPVGAPTNIAILECVPLVLAAKVWGHTWSGRSVLFWTDSKSVQLSAASLLPKEPHLAALIRELAILSVQHNFRFKVEHIPGVKNVLADDLSRGNFAGFFARHSSANRTPSVADLSFEVNRLLNL